MELFPQSVKEKLDYYVYCLKDPRSQKIFYVGKGTDDRVFHHAQGPHVLANTICLSGALLVYNMLSVIEKNLGKGRLIQLFLSPLPEGPEG